MNKERRKRISAIDTAAIKAKAEELKGLIESAREEYESIRDEEQDYYDNMADNFQQSEKGEAAQEAIDNLDTIINALESTDALDEIVSSIEEIEQASF